MNKTEFETKLEELERLRAGTMISDREIAELIVIASEAKHDHPSTWARFSAVLQNLTDWKPRDIKAKVRRCRVTADLDVYPDRVEALIPIWMSAKGYTMAFTGLFTGPSGEVDAEIVRAELTLWNGQIDGHTPLFPQPLLDAAFNNWLPKERERLKAVAYSTIAFTQDADASHLTRFARMVTKDSGDDHDRDVKATEVALRAFIYRVKNHMRGRWKHGAHLMPVFFGEQGTGKTTAIEHLLSPICEFSSVVGFDILEDNSRSYDLSVKPVFFFDEMSSAAKADVEKLKGLMTAKSRQLRQVYGRAAERTLISTFIGATNRDLATLIRDETGNRRFLQIETPRMNRADILAIDALAIWRSVDENAEEAPMYADAEALAVVTAVQKEQRFIGPVEEWIQYGPTPTHWEKSSTLFADYYMPWLRENAPGKVQYETSQAFGKQMTALSDGLTVSRRRSAAGVEYLVAGSSPIIRSTTVMTIR